MALRAVRFHQAEQFATRVLPFLMSDEARNNLILGILTSILDHRDVYPERILGAVEEDDVVVAALLMTPPFRNVVISDLRPRNETIERAADVVARSVLRSFPGAAGVIGNAPYAACVAAACRRRGARDVRRHRALGVFLAERVTRPARPSGRARAATPVDRALVLDWYAAFAAEAHEEPPAAPTLRQVEDRLRREGSGIDLWETARETVSLCAFATSTPNGARIGPVYTPPAHRGQGYASALVADTTQRLLVHGRRFCFLNTDLANPTSNHIYTAIGYERVCDAEEWRFRRA